jgi:hypothetical protein
MKLKLKPRMDLCNWLGVAAMLLGIAVIVGIVFTYVDIRQPRFGSDISARMNAPHPQQTPPRP